MNRYICDECCEEFDGPYAVGGRRVTRTPPCPGCGPGTKVIKVDDDPREKGDDDGREYADPRDVE